MRTSRVRIGHAGIEIASLISKTHQRKALPAAHQFQLLEIVSKLTSLTSSPSRRPKRRWHRANFTARSGGAQAAKPGSRAMEFFWQSFLGIRLHFRCWYCSGNARTPVPATSPFFTSSSRTHTVALFPLLRCGSPRSVVSESGTYGSSLCTGTNAVPGQSPYWSYPSLPASLTFAGVV